MATEEEHTPTKPIRRNKGEEERPQNSADAGIQASAPLYSPLKPVFKSVSHLSRSIAPSAHLNFTLHFFFSLHYQFSLALHGLYLPILSSLSSILFSWQAHSFSGCRDYLMKTLH